MFILLAIISISNLYAHTDLSNELALEVCNNQSINSKCSFEDHHENIFKGSCQKKKNQMICVQDKLIIKKNLKKGAHLFFKNSELIRLHCQKNGCNKSKSYTIHISKAVRALKQRIRFEIYTIRKNHKKISNSKLLKRITYLKKLEQLDLKEKIKKEAKNKFKSKDFRDLLFAATDASTLE